MADPKIDALKAVGVDVEEGLQYCRNNEKIFLKIIQKYAEDAENKITEIKGYYDNKDFENYGIQVHGLKSSSKTMGVMDVSELAKEQEFAAKDGNIEKIDAEHEKLFSLYKERTQKILQALSGEAPAQGGAGASGSSLSKEELNGRLKELIGFLSTFETTKAEEVVSDLLTHSFEEASVSEKLKEIKASIEDFDVRTATKQAEEMM